MEEAAIQPPEPGGKNITLYLGLLKEAIKRGALRGLSTLHLVKLKAWIRIHAFNAPSLLRYSTHLAVLLLVVTAMLASQIEIPKESQPTPDPTPVQRSRIILTSRGGPRPADNGYLTKAPVPRTIIAEQPSESTITITELPRKGIVTYIVKTGDTVYDIAERFGISGETILWANGKLEDNPDLLTIGQELSILPVSGVYHTVEEGDTLEGIAKEYKVDVAAITQCEYNELEEPYEIVVGQKFIVPGGKKPYIPRVVHAYSGPIPEGAAKGTGDFGWPVSGVITQKYWEHHRAIDIGAPKGTPVHAADSGYVVFAGWNGGYGNMVLINHGNGFETLYSHFSWYGVDVGQSVKKGELIGRVGSTGHSTGPHLHFEIRLNGVKRNPFGYLP